MSFSGQFVGAAGLFARVAPWDPRLLWYAIALVGLLLVGAYVIWLTDRWRKREHQSRTASGDELAHFRRLYERGEFSAEEFARIRGLLTDRMMKELERLAPAEPATPANPPPGEPAP